jgi:predicted Rossmann fold flavoprotein
MAEADDSSLDERQFDARYEVIVVGAGAAGLLAATRLAELGCRTLLVEKNRKPGVKILISGGTRCNLTHDCDERGIVAAFGSAGKFLHSPLAALSPRELVELIEAEGVPTYVEAGTGKIFPKSDRALDIVAALMARLRRSGAELALDEPAVDVKPTADGFEVLTSRRKLACDKLLITVGGQSYPGCGTTGDGYGWLAALGHTIRPPRPALVPLTSDEAWVRELSGIALPDVLVRVVDPELATTETPAVARRRGLAPGVLIERRTALLFTHFGLSGPAALDVSRAVTGADDPRRLRLDVDCLPDVSTAALDERLRAAAATDGRRQVIGALDEFFPRRIAVAIFAQAGVAPDRRFAELSKNERAALVAAAKALAMRVNGSRGFAKAEVTAGGVALDEVDSRTMQSKRVPNLYLAGEILDFDGFIGGYNFQAAFSTAWLAAQSMAGRR